MKISTGRIVILGSSGTAIEILETIRAINRASGEAVYECVGLLDDNPGMQGQVRHGVRVLGPISAAMEMDCLCLCGFGSSRSIRQKEKVLGRIAEERFPVLVHPAASVSETAALGPGTVIFQKAVVCADARVGAHVVALPCSVVSHDDCIGDFTCLATGVCLSGNVRVGKACYLGCNSAVRENLSVGDFSVIGMGSVVTRNVEANTVVVGNPARRMRCDPAISSHESVLLNSGN